MTFLESTVVNYLKDAVHKIEHGECKLTEEEAIDIMSSIAHIAVSREKACQYLNVNKSRFNELIQEGVVPKGEKEKGWKELRWYKDELIKIVNKFKWK